MPETGRMFLCGLCRAQVVLCRRCDRGQIYCGRGCAGRARGEAQREAGERYQRSRRGRFAHAARALRYRARCKIVTHQGSAEPAPGDLQLWGNDDPLFPATRIALGDSRQFEAAGLERAHWRSAARIRTIFQEAFASAGLPYFNPHSFRSTLVRLGQSVCQTPEEFKAWSQNLGHDKVLTTFLSYGQVESPRQGEIIRGLGTPQVSGQADLSELAKALVREMGLTPP